VAARPLLRLEPAACSRGLKIVSGVATVAALIQLARLAVFMVDPSQVGYSFMPASKWEVEHSCLSAYFVAAQASSSTSNIYDNSLYSNYYLGRETATGLEFVKYPDGPRLPNLDYVFSANTPQRGGVELDALVLWGKDENFYEWSSADIIFLNVGAAWKPTDKLRVDARYQLQSFRRRTDDSIVGIRRIPRVKAEYQISRPIFVRVVGEYNSDWQDDLRDDSRTNLPIYIRNAGGEYQRAAKTYIKSFRADWLFSYQPTPGTVLFAGYGNTLANAEEDSRTARLRRTVDGFFLKLSYLFRL